MSHHPRPRIDELRASATAAEPIDDEPEAEVEPSRPTPTWPERGSISVPRPRLTRPPAALFSKVPPTRATMRGLSDEAPLLAIEPVIQPVSQRPVIEPAELETSEVIDASELIDAAEPIDASESIEVSEPIVSAGPVQPGREATPRPRAAIPPPPLRRPPPLPPPRKPREESSMRVGVRGHGPPPLPSRPAPPPAATRPPPLPPDALVLPPHWSNVQPAAAWPPAEPAAPLVRHGRPAWHVPVAVGGAILGPLVILALLAVVRDVRPAADEASRAVAQRDGEEGARTRAADEVRLDGELGSDLVSAIDSQLQRELERELATAAARSGCLSRAGTATHARVEVTLPSGGQPIRARVTDDWGDDEVARCLERAFGELALPPIDGAGIRRLVVSLR